KNRGIRGGDSRGAGRGLQRARATPPPVAGRSRGIDRKGSPRSRSANQRRESGTAAGSFAAETAAGRGERRARHADCGVHFRAESGMRVPAFWTAAGVGLLLATSLVTAQESPDKPAGHETTGHETTGHETASHEGASEGPSPIWAWANFAILAGALGYLIVKKGGPWFQSRSLAIRKGIAEAEEIRR